MAKKRRCSSLDGDRFETRFSRSADSLANDEIEKLIDFEPLQAFEGLERVDWTLQTQSVQCPFCWESFEVVIDPSVPEQTYVEDCFVCCRPIVFQIEVDESSGIDVMVSAGNE